MKFQKSRLIRLILLIVCFAIALPVQAQLVDIRDVSDEHVAAELKSALYDSSPGIIGAGNPDYPSGNVVVIPVETPDFPRNPYVNAGAVALKLALGGPYTYYKVASGGAFNLIPRTSDWAAIATNLWAYKSASGAPYDPSDHPKFMRAVLAAASVNWKQLDANSDGKISRGEAVILLLIPNRDPCFGWATTTSQKIGKLKTSAGTFNFGTLKVIYLSVTKECFKEFPGYNLAGSNYLDGGLLITIVHELLHAVFDLPDRYYDGYNGTGETGLYCNLSATSSWVLLNPHDRMKVGWIRPRILTPDHTNLWLKAPSVAAAQAGLILLDPERPDEYWLLENRNKSGSEASVVESGLPTEGLAVWWVRTRALADKTDNIRLVAASATDQDPDGDGIYGKAGKNNQGEWHAADWPINRDNPGYYWYPDSNSGVQDLFTEQSGPRTLYYSDGTPSKFGLYCISAPGETVTLWVGNKLPPSVLVPSLFMLLGR